MIITFMLLFPVVCAFSASTHVKTGLDVLVSEDFKSLSGKRVGVITNPTGVDAQKRSVVSLLAASKTTKLMAVFTPEHGFTGMSEADAIGSDKLKIGDHEIPLYSLYSGGFKGMRPTSKQLENIDALIFDIQDIGARFYTYLATMAMALEECKKANIEFIVLDRPNPIRGDLVEGPILEDASLRLVTPTAYFQVPIRHGLTAGEMATLYNRIVGHSRETVDRLPFAEAFFFVRLPHLLAIDANVLQREAHFTSAFDLVYLIDARHIDRECLFLHVLRLLKERHEGVLKHECF
jgi:uncharacterized protein YbbC (DUF1343 family)